MAYHSRRPSHFAKHHYEPPRVLHHKDAKDLENGELEPRRPSLSERGKHGEVKSKYRHTPVARSTVRRIEHSHGKLSYAERRELPDSDFAIPSERRYPIHNEAHARNALARVSEYGNPQEKAEVRAAVHKKYPGIAEANIGRARSRKYTHR